MTFEEVAGIAAAVAFGLWGARTRAPAWPLLANFGFLSFRFYGLGLGYDAPTFLLADTLTFGAIAIRIWPASRIDWRDIAILVLFVPAMMIYGFATDPSMSYWNLWGIGILQFALAAPWERIARFETRGWAWEV